MYFSLDIIVIIVASFMEAWIEIQTEEDLSLEQIVASFMEAWIEIIKILKN